MPVQSILQYGLSELLFSVRNYRYTGSTVMADIYFSVTEQTVGNTNITVINLMASILIFIIMIIFMRFIPRQIFMGSSERGIFDKWLYGDIPSEVQKRVDIPMIIMFRRPDLMNGFE